MKYLFPLAAVVLAGCASKTPLPEQAPFSALINGNVLEVSGVLVSSAQGDELKALALAQAYSAINSSMLSCDFADDDLDIEAISRVEHEVLYRCADAVEITPTQAEVKLDLDCDVAIEADKPETQWKGSKLPLQTFRGTFTISSEPAMSPELAANWAQQTLMANAVLGGYTCEDISITPANAECAHYGFVLQCVNL